MAVSACENIAVICDCTSCDDQDTRKSVELAKGEIVKFLYCVKIFPLIEVAEVEETDNVFCYNVDNKYYSAVISLCFDDASAEKADAILIIIDLQQVSNLRGTSDPKSRCKWSSPFICP